MIKHTKLHWIRVWDTTRIRIGNDHLLSPQNIIQENLDELDIKVKIQILGIMPILGSDDHDDIINMIYYQHNIYNHVLIPRNHNFEWKITIK